MTLSRKEINRELCKQRAYENKEKRREYSRRHRQKRVTRGSPQPGDPKAKGDLGDPKGDQLGDPKGDPKGDQLGDPKGDLFSYDEAPRVSVEQFEEYKEHVLEYLNKIKKQNKQLHEDMKGLKEANKKQWAEINRLKAIAERW